MLINDQKYSQGQSCQLDENVPFLVSFTLFWGKRFCNRHNGYLKHLKRFLHGIDAFLIPKKCAHCKLFLL